jgi:hypothetical protein
MTQLASRQIIMIMDPGFCGIALEVARWRFDVFPKWRGIHVAQPQCLRNFEEYVCGLFALPKWIAAFSKVDPQPEVLTTVEQSLALCQQGAGLVHPIPKFHLAEWYLQPRIRLGSSSAPMNWIRATIVAI